MIQRKRMRLLGTLVFLLLCSSGLTVSAATEKVKIVIDAEDDNTPAGKLRYAINDNSDEAFSDNNIFSLDKDEGYVVYVKDLAGNITSKVVTVSAGGNVTVKDDKNTGNSSKNKESGTTINVTTPYDKNTGNSITGAGTGTTVTDYGTDLDTGSGTARTRRIEGDGSIVEEEVQGDVEPSTGKEFYTIQTPDEHVFYLIIDHGQSQDNVYFLDSVQEKDLFSLINTEEDKQTVEEQKKKQEEKAETAVQQDEPAPEQEGEQIATEKPNSNASMVLIIIVMAVAVGAGYYFKVYKPKQQQLDEAFDIDEDFEPVPDEEDDDFDFGGSGSDSAADEEETGK